jgi:hypothetical protein
MAGVSWGWKYGRMARRSKALESELAQARTDIRDMRSAAQTVFVRSAAQTVFERCACGRVRERGIVCPTVQEDGTCEAGE